MKKDEVRIVEGTHFPVFSWLWRAKGLEEDVLVSVATKGVRDAFAWQRKDLAAMRSGIEE